MTRAEAVGAGRAAALAALLALPLALALLPHPRTTLYGEPGDGFGTLAGIEACAAALAGAGPWPRFPDFQPLVDVPAGLLARLLGPVPAYDLLVLASFPLAAASGSLAARALGVAARGATLAGLLFAFAPYHLAHAREHLDQAQTWPAGLVVWAALRVAARPSFRRGLALVATLLVAGLANWYLPVVLAPPALAGLGAGLVADRRAGAKAALAAGLGALLVAGVGWVVARGELLPLVAARGRLAADPGALVAYSARPSEYLRPSSRHLLWGGWAARDLAGALHGSAPVEQTLNLGIVPLALAIAGVVLAGRAGGERRRLALALALAAVAALWLSLPPQWGASGRLHALLPWLRAVARFGLVVQLAVALLASSAVERLGRAAAAIAAGLALLEYAERPASFAVEPVEVSTWLEANATGFADFPPRPNRFLRAWRRPPVRHLGASELEAADATELALPDLERLRALGASHVVFHGESPPEVAGGVEWVATFRGAAVGEIVADPAPAVVLARAGCGPPEPGGGRWLLGRRAEFELGGVGDGCRVEGRLRFTARSHAETRAMAVTGAGRDALVAVPADSDVAVDLEVEAPGRLRFEWAPPAAPAADGRPLAVRLGRVEFDPRAWSCAGVRLALGPSVGPLEAGGTRWVKGPAELAIASGLPGELRFEARTASGQRTLRVRCGDGVDRNIPMDRDWKPVRLRGAAGRCRLEAGPAESLGTASGSADPRLVSFALRRLAAGP